MPISNFLKRIFGSNDEAAPSPAARQPKPGDPPTPAEWDEARQTLEAHRRQASYAALGGFRPPDPASGVTCWWGGNLLARPDEPAPVCSATGNPLAPVLQLHLSDLPHVPECLKNLALLTLWLDLKEFEWDQKVNGAGFLIRTYSSLEGLAPASVHVDQAQTLPVFPIAWSENQSGGEVPSWEDFADNVPQRVAWSSDSGWFFDNAGTEDNYKAAVKVGGWPQWIQGSQWPDGTDFTFQINSTEKGKLGFGDAGSVYVFRDGDNWQLRGDWH